MNKDILYKAFRIIFLLFVCFVAGYLTLYVSALIYPFIIALLLAFLINPLVNFFQEKAKLPRSFAVSLSIILMIVFIAGLVTLLIAEIIAGTSYLAKVVPTHVRTLILYLETLFASQIIPLYEQLNLLFRNLDVNQQETIIMNIQSVGESVGTSIGEFIKNLLERVPTLISWLPNAATGFIFSLLATFFISKDWYKLQRMSFKFLSAKAASNSREIFSELKKALFGFIKAQATLISITTIIVLIGLLILGVDYAITIALIIGFVDILPYLGTGLIFVPWILYLAFSGGTKLAIGLTILYIIVLVQRQLMEPKVLSTTIGLDPLATLVSLFVGFQLFGFLGLIIGPVSLVIINTLHKVGISHDMWSFIVGEGGKKK